MGTLYFDTGDFWTATEGHKRAFLLSDFSVANINEKVLCVSIFRLCNESEDYTELIHTLTFIANKVQDLHFLSNLLPKYLWREYFGTLWEFLIYLKSFSLTTKQVQIAEYLKNILCEKNPKTARKIEIGQYNSFNKTNVVYALGTTDILHVLPAIDPEGERTHVMYDYFEIMSQVNYGSIQCLLQHQLRTQMIDDDITFKGYSGAIDFDSCSSLCKTTNDGIIKSRKTIFVLSNDFLTREWCPLKRLITETLQRRPDFLLIILLEHCEVPSEINYEHVWYFDFKDDRKIPIEIQHLKLALLAN